MQIRNIAIIAHVDHGKTTLVDTLFKQSGMFRSNQNVEERAMDSNDLEKERGITILSKCTSIVYKDVRINIVDTPGHADFGGEVERILSMVDCVILLVDAAEGPMPQTKFVLTKALALNLRPIVVINKIDRSDARPKEVIEEIFDLFVSLNPTELQLDFPILYASGRAGWAVNSLDDINKEDKDINPLLDMILSFVKEPDVVKDAPFSMLITTREYDNFLGRTLTGKIQSGKVSVNMQVHSLNLKGEVIEKGRIQKILGFRGLKREPIEEAEAGDIVIISGLDKTSAADTVCSPEVTVPIQSIPVAPPTLSMSFSVNDSPLCGKDGKKLTSRMIYERLIREEEGNVSIKVTKTPDQDAFEVAGRGELLLGILIETMRREGFELSIGRPKVLYKFEDGKKLEPIEDVQIDVDEEFVGTVIESLNLRKGEMIDMTPTGSGKTRMKFLCPSRGLIGYHGQFMTDTRGTGVLNKTFYGYAPYKGDIPGRKNGVLIATDIGTTTAYSLNNVQERGELFVGEGAEVYQGMIIGEHNRDNDLDVNPLKGKQLTNVRASGKDEAIKLSTPRLMPLEVALSYIAEDEIVEVTPNAIRIRKIHLNPSDRKRANKKS